jgi:hypothetical protein
MFSFFGSNRSPLWRKVRSEHIKQNTFCKACGSKKSLEVHHIEPFHVSPEKELDPNNLITLCDTCHLVFGHLMDYKSWNTEVKIDAETQLNKVMRRPYHEKVFSSYNDDRGFISQFISWYKRSFYSR